jgi:hypothetical protein
MTLRCVLVWALKTAACPAELSKVHLLVRSSQLSESMSQYLIARIDAHPKIEIHYLTQIVGMTGAAHLESIDWKEDTSELRVTNRIRHVFVMAGAAPRTEWLEDSFVLDKKGFIVTGPDLVEYGDFEWPLSRSPLLLPVIARDRGTRSLCPIRHTERTKIASSISLSTISNFGVI